MSTVNLALRTLLHPVHLRRTALIALAVGSWLTLVNQADVLLSQPLTTLLLVKVALNFLTPFVVANLGLLSATRRAPPPPDAPRD